MGSWDVCWLPRHGSDPELVPTKHQFARHKPYLLGPHKVPGQLLWEVCWGIAGLLGKNAPWANSCLCNVYCSSHGELGTPVIAS